MQLDTIVRCGRSPDLETIFVTSLSKSLQSGGMPDANKAGALFAIRGLPEPKFADVL